MFQNAIKLDQRVAIYVPATDNVSEAADNSAMVESCAAMLSEFFGGATIQPGRGAWVSDRDGLVLEDTTVVYAYCTAEDLHNHAADIERFALEMKRDMHQEAVSVEVNRELYIIA